MGNGDWTRVHVSYSHLADDDDADAEDDDGVADAAAAATDVADWGTSSCKNCRRALEKAMNESSLDDIIIWRLCCCCCW